MRESQEYVQDAFQNVRVWTSAESLLKDPNVLQKCRMMAKNAQPQGAGKCPAQNAACRMMAKNGRLKMSHAA